MVAARKVVLCFFMDSKLIMSSISCLYSLDGSDIHYIVYIVCIFPSGSFFACGCLVNSTHCQHKNRPNDMQQTLLRK